MAAGSVIATATCAKLVSAAATGACPAVQSTPTEPAHSALPWDALANSFASLSAAFAWGALFLAVLAVAAGVGWGFLVKGWAEKEARREAAECVKKQMDKWLTDEAPGLIRQHVENLQNASLGGDGDGEAADEMGKEAG